METIYLADDERHIRELMQAFLSQAGYDVHTFEDGDALMTACRQQMPDLVILDIMMPGTDGLSVCTQLRQQNETLPIIIVSAKDSPYDRVTGLTLGGDDYLIKPFLPLELVARVKALLRRSGGADESLMTCGNVTLDSEKRMVYVDGKPVELTYKEFELLKLLMKNHGIVISRDVIMERVWDSSFEGESRTIDVHVRTLRQKLGDGGALIKTIRNVGYMAEAK